MMAEDIGKVCTCSPYMEAHGEWMMEYNPECQVHSNHFFDPRFGGWVSTKNPHQMILVEGEIEVCDTCRNVNGERVAWDQTWHALHKDLARQIQHCWRPIEPGSERLVSFCEDPLAKPGQGMNTSQEYDAVPVCVKCHRLAMANARREEWNKATSPEAIHIFKTAWNIAAAQQEKAEIPQDVTKVGIALRRVREVLGR